MLHPALDVRGVDGELALAVVDQHGPTAVEERAGRVRIFFSSPRSRHEAHASLSRELPSAVVAGVDVDDEDWARRSQQNLDPVTVERITVLPRPQSLIPHHDTIAVVIAPSTGFGTGHHATTRLCLRALQSIDLAGASVLDVGTGSGVLAIAARKLGARQAVGIDNDPDAISAAVENLRLNQLDGVRFDEADVTATILPRADVVTANLTRALLQRAAPRLFSPLGRGGTLIVSGVLAEERDPVVDAFAAGELVWEAEEDGWVGLRFVMKAANSRWPLDV